MSTTQKNKGQILPAIAVSLVSFVLAAFACELVLEYRYNKDQERVSRQVDPYYSWTFYTSDKKRVSTRKGPLGLMLHPKVGYVNFPDQQTENFSINSQGFRGPEVVPKKEGVRRIVLVGGSTAFGTGLNSDEETFANQVTRRFENVEVINGAVIGHRSGQELSYIVSDLVDLEPDLIIALNGYNDFASRKDEPWIDMNGASQVEGQLNVLNGYVYSGLFSRLVNMAKIPFVRTSSTVEKALGKFSAAANPQQTVASGSSEVVDKAVDSYTENVWKMDQIASTFSARFLCVLQPTSSWVDKGEDGLYDEFRQQAEARLMEKDVAILDLNDHADAFLADMFMDDLHLDARGNKIMAAIVAQQIRDEGFWDESNTTNDELTN